MSVSITLEKSRYEVTPGGTFTIALTITNTGTKVEQFHVNLRGLPGTSVSVEPPVLNIEGQRHQDVLLRVAVPVDASIRAGRQVGGIHVWAKNDRSAQRLREFELAVRPHPGFAMSVAKKGRRNGRYQHAAVTLANTGNVPLRLRATGADPKNLVKVEVPDASVEVEPFETVELDALLRGPLKMVGSPTSHMIRFHAKGMQLERDADYPMEQRAWLGKSLKPYLAIGLVAVALVLLWPRSAVVADYVGQQVEAVEEALDSGGFTHEVDEEDGTEPRGTVLATRPPAGEEVRLGGVLGFFAESVVVVVSNGPPTMEVPPGLVGQPRAVADDLLGALRTFGAVIEYQTAPSDEIEEQRVVRTVPGSGEPLLVGDTLTIVVSTGPAPFATPGFEGMDIGELNSAAEQAGLEVDRLERAVDDQALDGLVVDQNPRPDEPIRRGSTVTVWIGVFEEPAETEPPTTTAPPEA